MDIYDLVNDFLEHLEIESGRSKKTVENYRLYLERFVEIAQEILNKDEIRASDISKELLRKYRLKLNRFGSDNGSEDLKTITQAYHLIALRGFLKYLARREIKSLDPSLVELPHVVRKQVTFLHFDEVEDM
ncbi:site-specific integrase, partial [Candidatus Saccharibacteria bacterium]|nr:site-specific integrase [Candidatus Saccharibacteria bacterium]